MTNIIACESITELAEICAVLQSKGIAFHALTANLTVALTGH